LLGLALEEFAVPGEGAIDFMSDKERAFTVLQSVIKVDSDA